MNLKLKATLVWVKLMIMSAMITALLLGILWLLAAYPIIIGCLTVGLLIVFAIVDTWLCIYYDLKEDAKNGQNEC